MAVLTAGFELGADGATVSPSDRGDGDAWDNGTTIGAGATCIYDSTHAALGAQSCKIATGGTSSASLVQWDTKFGVQTDHYTRIYFYLTAFPATNRMFARVLSGASNCAGLGITTAGKVYVNDSAGTTKATGAVTIGLNQWIRVEWHVTHSTTAGVAEAKLFNTASATVADETITAAGSFSTLASGDRIRFGVVVAIANAVAFWIDQIQAGAAAYPGPAPVGWSSMALLGVGT